MNTNLRAEDTNNEAEGEGEKEEELSAPVVVVTRVFRQIGCSELVDFDLFLVLRIYIEHHCSYTSGTGSSAIRLILAVSCLTLRAVCLVRAKSEQTGDGQMSQVRELSDAIGWLSDGLERTEWVWDERA